MDGRDLPRRYELNGSERRDGRSVAEEDARSLPLRENDMEQKTLRWRLVAWALGGLALQWLCGCGSLPSDRNQNGSGRAAETGAPTIASASGDNPRVDLQCAAGRIQNAPAPFHWSLKKAVTPDTNTDWEADVTADAIAGTVTDSSGTRAIHGTRSDQTSWNTAVMILTAPLPASVFALVNNSSGIVRAGRENMNGQDTVKFKIDTSEDTQADASLIHNVFGAGGFVKSTAWVTSKGCPIKFLLDVEQHNQDGTVEKEHYEENVTKE